MSTNKTKSTLNIAQAPLEDGHHVHKCIKCGMDYVHYHEFKNAEHPQFSFQCPNADCEWHYSKGVSAKPGATPTDDTPPKRPTTKSDTETYAQRSVRIAFGEGNIKCGKANHFVMRKDGQYKKPVRLPALDIIAMMPIGQDAKCHCEQTACREAWSMNRPGCFETDWVQPGSYHRGYGKYEPTFAPRRIMPINFHPSKKDLAYLHEHAPGWLFVTVGTEFHDHPVAHTLTQVATYNLFHSLRPGRYIDVHGNPAMCERLNAEMKKHTFTSMNHIESAQDAIRARTKWGDSKVGDTTRWYDCALRDLHATADLTKVDGLTSVNTLYYYTHDEVVSQLVRTKGKMMYAIMHRFKGDSGSMNNGEQVWVRYKEDDGRVMIRQTNVLTGSQYVHACNEHWFQNNSWMPERDLTKVPERLQTEEALSWDINLAADGIYALRITTCTNATAGLDTTYVAPVRQTTNVGKFNSSEYIKATGTCVISSLMREPTTVELPAAVQPFFNEMRLKMVGATARDTKKYVAHAQYVALKAKSIMASENAVPALHDVQIVYDIVYASFWIDGGLDHQYQAFVGRDLRQSVLDCIVIGLHGKSAAAGFAELLRSIRHRL